MGRTFNPTLRASLSDALSWTQADGNFGGIADIANAAAVTYGAVSQEAMLDLSPPPQRGDFCMRADTGTLFYLEGYDPAVLGSWVEAVSSGGGGGNGVIPEGQPAGLPSAGTFQLYGDAGFNPLDRVGSIPVLSDFTSAGFVITQSANAPNREAWKLFDHDETTAWGATSSSPWWMGWARQDGEAVTCYGYGMKTVIGYPNYMPSAWQILGNDTDDPVIANWTVLDARDGYDGTSTSNPWRSMEFLVFECAVKTPFKYHRLYIDTCPTNNPAIAKMFISHGTPVLYLRDSGGVVTPVAQIAG